MWSRGEPVTSRRTSYGKTALHKDKIIKNNLHNYITAGTNATGVMHHEVGKKIRFGLIATAPLFLMFL